MGYMPGNSHSLLLYSDFSLLTGDADLACRMKLNDNPEAKRGVQVLPYISNWAWMLIMSAVLLHQRVKVNHGYVQMHPESPPLQAVFGSLLF
jgi:hypothetical protein